MNHEYLNALVKAFVAPAKQSRLLTFLGSSRRYPDFLDGLLHDPRYFDPDVVEVLPGNQRSLSDVSARLSQLGANRQAYLVGDCRPYLDGHVGPLDQLLAACVGSMTDSLVYCWQNNVAYYEGHEGFGYILHRLAQRRSG